MITSGNVLFESSITNKKQLESRIEKAIQKELGFTSTTIIRSKLQLTKMINRNPFRGKPDSPNSQQNVTFLKRGGEIFMSIDITDPKAGSVMAQIERDHGKQVTTRTWKTVGRIVKAFSEPVKAKRKAE